MLAGNVQASGPADTTITLTVTSGQSPVTEVNSATAITLTATVTAANVHVTKGTVNFCDTTVSPCTDIHVVATAQLTSAGTAIVKFVPGVGTHTYTADFLGTSSYTRSQTTPQQLRVESTAVLPTKTFVTASGGVGGYDLTATVTGLLTTPGLPAPTGTVTFATVPGGAPVAMGELSAPKVPSLSLLNSSNPAVSGGGVFAVVVADFNGDGNADLAVVGGAVTILLGNGDGTFTPTPPLNYSCAGGCETPIVADLNGDGIPDLGVGNTFITGGGAVVSGLDIFLGKGDGTFTELPGPVTLDDDFAWTWVVGDFNGDGVQDLAAGGVYYGCWISLGNGDGTFTPPTEGPCDSDATSLAVGDFNGDGVTDLAATGNTFQIDYSDVELLLGKNDGTFTLSPTGPWLQYSADSGITNSALVAGDFNGDGLLDMAVAQTGNANDIVILIGQSGARFTQGTTIPVAVGIAPGILTSGGLSLGDFNGDGIPDLVVVGNNANNLQIFLGKGDGTFLNAPGSPFTVGTGEAALAVGNFHGGDLSDLAVGAQAWLTLLRETSVATATGVTLPGSGTNKVTASYSGDSLFAASTSNPLLLLQATVITLSESPKRTVRGGIVNLTATVVDSKGQPVIAGGSVSFYNGTTLLSTVQVTAVSNGSSKAGTATYQTRALPVGTSSLTAKFNGTNIDSPNTSTPETVTITGKYPTATSISAQATGADYTLTGTVTSYAPFLPTGDVKFVDTTLNSALGSAALSASAAGFNFVTGARQAAGTYPSTVVLADLNNDGKLDMVVGNYGSIKSQNYQPAPTFTVFLGNGDGTYAAPNNVGANLNGVSGIAVGDFNHDGKLDIATAYGDSFPETPIIGIFLGNGDGTFGVETDYVANAYSSSYSFSTSSITVGDFNHDGKQDLVMAAAVGNSSYDATGVVSVMLGNGDGTFQAPQSFEFGSEPFVFSGGIPPVLAVGDFNGDGRLDLAVASSAGNNYLAIMLGNGDGTFKPASRYGTGLSINAMAVADLNGDGKLDVVLATPEDTLMVWQGNGDGTLQPSVRVPAGPNSVAVAIGDLNGDGIPDLAVSYYGSNNLGLYVGNGDGTFQTPATIKLNNPTALALGDVNNDGRLDIAAVDSAANNITIFLNRLSVSATLTGVHVPGTETQSIVGTYLGDASFDTSTSKAVDISKSAP